MMIEGDPVAEGAAGPNTAGEQLRAAREARGLNLDDVAASTRVPLRHLEAIEQGRYADLPSPTYAVGFARAYARAVGLPDAPVAAQVRAEVDRIGPRQPEYTPYEMADPARVPSRGVAIVAAGLALALLVLGALWFLSTRYAGGAETSATNAVVAAIPAAPAPTATPTPAGGQVTLTATDEVWVRVYDAADETLFIGNMKAGDRFDVPTGANDPRINVGRPDKLAITLNGSTVPPLGSGARPLSGVRVSGEAIAQRLRGEPAAAPSPAGTPPATPLATVEPAAAVAVPLAAPTAQAKARSEATPRPRAPLTETQRANLESAARLKAQQGNR